MGMSLSPIGVVQPQNQAAADKVASSLWSKPAGVQPLAQAGTAGAPAAAASSMAATSTTTSSSSSNDTVTSNDFLTLLVAEMRNQDPTQPTDPNAYIQQLVGVNSLQQLIAINQDLTPAAPTTGVGTGTGSGSSAAVSPMSAVGVAMAAPASSLYGSIS